MKKGMICAILAATLVLVLTACSGEDSSSSSSNSGSAPKQAAQMSQTDDSSSRTDSGTLGDYAVSIDDCILTKDYEGNAVALVTFTFTNNSDSAQMYDIALIDRAYQDGIQLEGAYVMDKDSEQKLLDNAMKNIQPGKSLQIGQAYMLDDKSTDLSVQVQELISLSDATVEKVFTFDE